MQITIHNTSKIVILKAGSQADGVSARVWEGETESGIKLHCFITLIACDAQADTTEFQAELMQRSAPTPEIEAIPDRLIL